jgi:hypothetical protein
MIGYETFPRWIGWRIEDRPLLVIFLCVPLAQVTENTYGCRVVHR